MCRWAVQAGFVQGNVHLFLHSLYKGRSSLQTVHVLEAGAGAGAEEGAVRGCRDIYHVPCCHFF